MKYINYTVTTILFPLLICPLLSYSFRYERVTDDKDDDGPADKRAENSCTAQYQSTTLRVLTHFVAESDDPTGSTEEDGMGQQKFLLGSDWQVEVTQLVKDSLRVEDPKVAQLLDGQVVIGLSTGNTKLQVVCVCVCFSDLSFLLLSLTSCSHLCYDISCFCFFFYSNQSAVTDTSALSTQLSIDTEAAADISRSSYVNICHVNQTNVLI